MRWSKLKQRVEANFADVLKGRVTINSTRYGNCTCGHAWFTLDGEIIANYCTRAFYNRYYCGDIDNDRGLSNAEITRYKNQYVEYGELTRQGVYQSCWAFIHDLGIQDAFNSDDPIIQSLLVMDKRVGKQRLLKLEKSQLYPLAEKLLRIRLNLIS